MKNIISRTESPDLSIRNRFSYDVARSELESMERDARYALFFLDQQIKIEVREYQRQARDTVCQAVQESSESYEDMMMREFLRYSESIWRTNGRIWKKSRSYDWIRSTRSFTWSKKPHVTRTSSTSPSRRKRKKFFKSQMHSELHSHIVCYRRVLHEREVPQEHMSPKFSKHGTQWCEMKSTNIMMTTMMQNVQEFSESERQAVISAREMAVHLQSKVSQATIASDSAKTKQKRSQTAKLTHHYTQLDPQTATHESNFHRLPLLFRTHVQSPMSISKKQEAEKFEFELWSQASTFGSWKVSFRQDVISGSTHPRSISDWSGEIDVAATVRELDHSRFVFDKHQMEFEIFDPKNATRIMKITQAEFKRKIDSLEETQYKNECPRFTGRQIMFQTFSFFNITKTQGHTMNLNDSLNVELYNDNQDAWRTECDL